MRKIVSLFLSVVMLLSLFAMPAMATVEGGVVLLDMDFTDATPANLLDTMTTGTTNANKLFTTTDENIKISWTSSDTTNAPQTLAGAKARGYVGVVNAATEGVSDANHTGNVFKFFHKQGAEAAGKGFLMTKLAPNMNTDATVDNHTVVMEYDVYLQAQSQQTGVLNILKDANDYHGNYLSNHTNLYQLGGGATIMYNGGLYDKTTNTSPQKSDVVEYLGFTSSSGSILGKWAKVRVVADLTAKEGVVKDTFRLYVNDVLQGTNFDGSERKVYDLQEYNGNMFADTFYGLEMGGKTGSNTKAVYYDNVKVTKYPGKFEVLGQTVNGTDLTVTFNRNIDASTKDNAYVIDAEGTKVNATISASGKTLTVSGLAEKTAYKLVLPVKFTDELGQGLVTFYVNNSTSDAYAAYKSSDKVLDFTTGTSPVKVTTLIDMDFDNLADFDVMDEFTTAASGYKYKDGIGAGLSYASASAETIDTIKAASSVEVVSTNIPGGRTGKVLKYFNYAGYTTYSKGRNHVIGQIQPIGTLTDTDLDLTNSILVTEYDMYVENVATATESTIASPSAIALTSNNVSHNSVIQADTTNANLTVTEISSKASTKYTNTLTGMNSWKKVRIVVDTADNSYRMYVDGALVQVANSGVVKNDIQVGCARQTLATFPTTFYGLSFGGYARDDADTSKGAVYYDNIKVYKVNKDFAIAEKTDDVFASFGANDTATITFTTNVDADTADEIYLATTEGAKVEGGISAVADGTKVNITLGDSVAKGTYKLVIPATFTDIYGQGIGTYGAETVEIPVTSTAVVLEKAATIYEEDFEDWNNDNLLTTATLKSGTVYTADAKKTGETTSIPVQFNVGDGGLTGETAIDTSKNIIKAIPASEIKEEYADRGQVLQYTYASKANNTNFLEVLLGGGLATDLNGKTTVVEYDMYIKDKVNYDFGMPSISTSASAPANYLGTQTGWMLIAGTTMRAVGGSTSTEDNSANATYHWKQGMKSVSTGQWYNVKLVITDDGGTTESPYNWRAYIDDVPLTGKYYNHQSATSNAVGDYVAYSYESRNYDYKDSTKVFSNHTIDHKFHGVLIGGKTSTAGRTLYFDNFKVSTVNNGFAVTTATRDASKFNAVADVITMTFTQPVDKATVKNIKIVDKAGETLDAVKAVNYKDNDTVMEIQLDSDKLLGKEVYKVVLPATFTDVYGQGLVTYHNPYRSLSTADTTWYNASVPATADTLALTLTTAKATEIYIDDVTDGYSNGSFTKTVTVNSVATEALPVWIAAAAYDAKNNMVGFCAVDEFTLEAGATTNKDLSFTVEAGKTAKYVRVFVWNGEDTMKPYQAIEEITVQ